MSAVPAPTLAVLTPTLAGCREKEANIGKVPNNISSDPARIAAAAPKAVRKGKYLQINCNFDHSRELPAPLQALQQLRDMHKTTEYGWGIAADAFLQDTKNGTILLLGNESQCTGAHADWTESYNYGFAVGPVSCATH